MEKREKICKQKNCSDSQVGLHSKKHAYPGQDHAGQTAEEGQRLLHLRGQQQEGSKGNLFWQNFSLFLSLSLTHTHQ